MRRTLVCLLVIGLCGCGDDDSSGPGGSGGDGGPSGGGKGGTTASSGSGGSGAAGRCGGSSQPCGSSGIGGKGGGAGTGAGKGGGGGGGGNAMPMGMIKLVPNVIAGKQSASSDGNISSSQSALRVGSPTAMTLLSLKYYVTSIQLCEDLELAGSGFMNATGCIQLYQNMSTGSPDYNEYTVEEAKDDTTEGRYIDLMTSAGQAALRKPVMLQVPIATEPVDENLDVDDAGVAEDQPRQAGVYRYGLINFYRPIKVKAEFPIIGEPGQYYRTKAVTHIHETPASGGGLNTNTVEIGDTLNGATEETTYMLNNGGALFTFQKPFAITQADIDAKAEINIDLVFNPESFGQAYQTTCSADIRIVVCDPTNNVGIDMPYVRMSPVPRKTGEKTRKETYLAEYDANSKLRIELYYNDADDEAGVQGVDIAVVYNSTTPSGNMPSFNTIASNFVSQTGSVTTSDASVTLMDYRRKTNLEGLRRRQAGTLTYHCLFPGGDVCPTQDGTVTKAYTYEGDTVVSGN
jgi:hypothetical protein